MNEEHTKILEKLFKRQTFGIKLGLHVQEDFMRRLGNPERSFAVIHVAGTNGKGSVCALVEAVLRKAGLRTGLYTSPHLVRFNERIMVDGIPIPDEELAEMLVEFELVSQNVTKATGQEPTFFEYTTALALEYFRRKNVRVAIVETGMGGRLDATNVVEPVVSVITKISLEHTAYLGSNLSAIAAEKAGIIKPGRPVVCATNPGDALEVFKKNAALKKSGFIYVPESAKAVLVNADLSGQTVELATAEQDYGRLRMQMVGRHQAENLATAAVALETFCEIAGIPLSAKLFKTGVADAFWPGRLHTICKKPPVIVDGAHNPDAAEALADSLDLVWRKKPVGLIFGMCNDKDMGAFCKVLGNRVKKVWSVKMKTERTMDSELMATLIKSAGWHAEKASLGDALCQSKKWASENNALVCCCGSLYLVGEILTEIGMEWPYKMAEK